MNSPYRKYRFNLENIRNPEKRLRYILAVKRDFYRVMAYRARDAIACKTAADKANLLQSVLEEALTGIKTPSDKLKRLLP